MNRGLFALIAAIALSACGKPTVSGTFTGTSPDTAALVELVQVESGAVTGRAQFVHLNPDGTLQNQSAAVSGLSDGHNVSLAVSPISFLPSAVQLTGEVKGGQLTLGGGSALGVIKLVRSDRHQFEAKASELQNKAAAASRQRAAAEQAEREQQALAEAAQRDAQDRQELARQIAVVGGQISALRTRLANVHTKTPGVQGSFTRITAQMEALLERERLLSGADGQRAVQRGQIDVAINQGAGKTEQQYSVVQAARNEVSAAAANLGPQLVSIRASCSRLATPASEQSLRDACAALEGSIQQLGADLKAAGRDFAALDRTYAAEKIRQGRLVAEADHID